MSMDHIGEKNSFLMLNRAFATLNVSATYHFNLARLTLQ